MTEASGPGSGTLLRVADLKKFFPIGGIFGGPTRGWIRAVDGISFTIHPRETLALVGESGCGKTTTARLLLLLEKQTSGSIWFGNRNIHKLGRGGLREYRSLVQAVFQDPWSSLNPRMRVADIVLEPLVTNTKLSRKEKAKRAADLLIEVGLGSEAADRFPHEFSGGQRQRIAVARALAPNSKLIVLDEPVSSLDVSIRAQIMNLLKDLQELHGMSYLLIAHNLATVRYLSHHVAVMYLGRIVEDAASEDLFTEPLHPYTKALISASATVRPDGPDEEIIVRDIVRDEVPSPVNPPSGCRFHPRCPLRDRLGKPRLCEAEEPALREILPGHLVACHFGEENMRTAGMTRRSTTIPQIRTG
jgi:peptide/nickel transport system ATP-binding protein